MVVENKCVNCSFFKEEKDFKGFGNCKHPIGGILKKAQISGEIEADLIDAGMFGESGEIVHSAYNGSAEDVCDDFDNNILKQINKN